MGFLSMEYQPLCHPEPQAKGLSIVHKDEILRRLWWLRMRKKEGFLIYFQKLMTLGIARPRTNNAFG